MDNKLYKAITYVSGAIDDAADDGVPWRRQFITLLRQRGLGFIKVLDPTNKLPGLLNEIGETQTNLKDMKQRGDWDKLSKYAHDIIRIDLREVDLCDFLVARIDNSIHACGTYHEIILASQQKKPVLLISKQGKAGIPSWLFGILEHEYFFDSVEECVDYLVGVNNGSIEIDNKWVLIRKQLEEML
ncbi:MAG: hypothetical protein ACOC5T_07840 [Elusimicrobiota bacterium]